MADDVCSLLVSRSTLDEFVQDILNEYDNYHTLMVRSKSELLKEIEMGYKWQKERIINWTTDLIKSSQYNAAKELLDLLKHQTFLSKYSYVMITFHH